MSAQPDRARKGNLETVLRQAEVYTYSEWFILMIYWRKDKDDTIISNILLLYNTKTNRFYVAVGLSSSRSQKTSKCGTKIGDTRGACF